MSKKGELIRNILLENYESYYRLAFSYVHQEADAMDIVQEGAYKAILKADTLKNEKFAGTWVYRIIINEAKEYLRKNKRDYVELDENLASVQGYYRDMDLEKALDKLQESEKALIILRYYEDKQLGEIAEIFQENLNTIKSRLYRTLKKLREELSALENKEGPDSVPGYLRIQEEAGGGSKGKALGGRLRYWDGREECENE